MSEAFVELLFWIVVFVVFFFGFRRLQNRKKNQSRGKEGKPDDLHAGKDRN